MWSADEWGPEQGTVTSLRIAEDGSLETLDTLSTGAVSIPTTLAQGTMEN
jgi:hypothetical protein